MVNQPKHALDPSDNLMTGRIRRFIQINHPRADVGFEISFKRRASHGDGSEMSGANEQFIVVSEQERPFAGVENWNRRFRFDNVGVVVVLLRDYRICSRHWVCGVRMLGINLPMSKFGKSYGRLIFCALCGNFLLRLLETSSKYNLYRNGNLGMSTPLPFSSTRKSPPQ